MALSVAEPYREQVFPAVYTPGIQRSRPLAAVRRVEAGGTLYRTREVGHGRTVALASRLEITHINSEERQLRTTYETGVYMGGNAQPIVVCPTLVVARVLEPLEALVISLGKLGAPCNTKTELADGTTEAPILCRAGLIEQGAGSPVIFGPVGHGKALLLVWHLFQNEHPYESRLARWRWSQWLSS
jgi:thioredoxin reductase (NADPH)